MDVAILSPKTNLSVANYHQMQNGTVRMGQVVQFKEAVVQKKGKF